MLLPTAIPFFGVKSLAVSLFRLHQPKFKKRPMEQKTSSRAQRWKQILAIAWPLIVANSFWNLQLTIDRIYLEPGRRKHWSGDGRDGCFLDADGTAQQTAGYVTTFVAQYFARARA